MPSLNNCGFGDYAVNMDITDSYNTDAMSWSCAQQLHSVHTYNDFLEEYNAKLETYNTDKTAYNAARTAENDRRSDFFKNAFDAPVAIPARPSIPWTPAAYDGVEARRTALSAVGATEEAIFTPADNTAKLTWSGILVNHITTGSGATAVQNIDYTGHVFGVSGQGEMSMPGDDANAWSYRVTATAPGVSGNRVMMVSIFPEAATMTGDALRSVEIEVSRVAFYQNFAALPFHPMVPVLASTDLTASIGAKALTAGVAAAAIALSLF